ncbi:hypothetical protein M8C13_19295 [Crossiella sp. SN42]|uniref:hypothetical protein n=1 Tax=Crossiella sp. SN42 TaxID=2944808 RepID=UPI00207CC8B7|nr:hypothetical protein [Crossiella sp. SN42]MCO1577903.1 hypothetical protein [Crossiella sp. SN42]
MGTPEFVSVETAESVLRQRWTPGIRAVDLAQALLSECSAVSAIVFIAAFRRAFDIPIATMTRAQNWQGRAPHPLALSDEGFDELLAPWMKSGPVTRSE